MVCLRRGEGGFVDSGRCDFVSDVDDAHARRDALELRPLHHAYEVIGSSEIRSKGD